MSGRPRLSDRLLDAAACPDPAAVLDATVRGDRLVLRTSGTSGATRSVVRSAASWSHSFPHVSALLSVGHDARVWVPGPLSSTMNLFAAVHAAWAGATVVSDPRDATHAHLTPSALARCLDDGAPLTGVHVLVAGDRLAVGLHDQAAAAGARISHYYGAAELSFVAWGSHEDDLHPFPEVDVVDREGVLWVRSPYLADGYEGEPGALLRDPDGYATVGDRGHVAGGLVRVLGRGTEAVTTSGVTVLVADVEHALRPAVAGGELVVIGVPHPDLGAVLCGVLTDGARVDAVRARARSVLDGTHRPRRWFAVDHLPLTAAGKVDRAGLAALVASTGKGVRRLP